MQISDMLGQYNKNVTTSSTEELKGATGMQKMVSTVGELSVGNIFEGTVKSVRNGKVTLALSNGQTITAQLEGKVNLQIGSPTFFQVKSNDGGIVAIRPYNDGTNNGNPILTNALTAAGIPVTMRNLSMVDCMMQEQLPIDKQSLLSMVRVVSTNPDVSVRTVVAMTKMGIPVSNELAAQFENYMNDQHAILNEMEHAMTQITGQLGDEAIPAELSVKLNQQVLDILLGQTGGIEGQNSDGGVLTDDGTLVSGNLLAGNGQDGMTAGEVQDSVAGVQGENAGHSAGMEVLPEGMAQMIDPEKAASTGYTENAGQSAGAAGTPDSQQAVQNQVHSNILLSQVLSDSQIENLTKLLWNTPTLVDNQTLFPQLAEEDVFVDTMQDDGAVPVSQPELAEGIEAPKTPALNANMKVEEFLLAVQNGLAGKDGFGFSGVQKLFGSKEYQTLLQTMMEQQWLIKPEELKSENKINELYEKLDKQMHQLESAMRSAGVDTASFSQTVTDIHNNIEFMNQINQTYTYVQLPLKMNGQNANGELYVYTNKKNLQDPDAEVTAFLHLDLEHLGSTDVSVKMIRRKVKTNFYFADDASYALVKQYLPILDAALKNKGYDCTFSVSQEEKKVNFVEDYLRKDQPTVGTLHRYSFDVRT